MGPSLDARIAAAGAGVRGAARTLPQGREREEESPARSGQKHHGSSRHSSGGSAVAGAAAEAAAHVHGQQHQHQQKNMREKK